MDEVIFEEFKGTGNSELRLSRSLADKRIFPAVDVNASSTRREEMLLSADEVKITWKLRRALAGLDQQQALEVVLRQAQGDQLQRRVPRADAEVDPDAPLGRARARQQHPAERLSRVRVRPDSDRRASPGAGGTLRPGGARRRRPSEARQTAATPSCRASSPPYEAWVAATDDLETARDVRSRGRVDRRGDPWRWRRSCRPRRSVCGVC